jgi:hypothetical protein
MWTIRATPGFVSVTARHPEHNNALGGFLHSHKIVQVPNLLYLLFHPTSSQQLLFLSEKVTVLADGMSYSLFDLGLSNAKS